MSPESSVSDLFGPIVSLCRCSESVEEQFGICPVCKGSQDPIPSVSGGGEDEESPVSDGVEPTGIFICSVPENYFVGGKDKEPPALEEEVYQTPEERLPTPSHAGADGVTSDLVRTIDLGRDTDFVFSDEKSDLAPMDTGMVETKVVRSLNVRTNATEKDLGVTVVSEGGNAKKNDGVEVENDGHVQATDVGPMVGFEDPFEQHKWDDLAVEAGGGVIGISARFGKKKGGQADSMGVGEAEKSSKEGSRAMMQISKGACPFKVNEEGLGSNISSEGGEEVGSPGVEIEKSKDIPSNDLAPMVGVNDPYGQFEQPVLAEEIRENSTGSIAKLGEKQVGEAGSLVLGTSRGREAEGLLLEGRRGQHVMNLQNATDILGGKESDNDDDDLDILDAARKAGMKFPRPRWWKPDGY